MQVDKFVGPLFWLGGGGKDAPDGRSGEKRSEADGRVRRRLQYIVTLVLGDQGQKLLGLSLPWICLASRPSRNCKATGPSSPKRSRRSRVRSMGSSTG